MGRLLLVRHGQASFGADDYDVLSETGWEQGRRLGAALRAAGVEPTAIVRGELRRHRETLEAVAETAGWDVGASGGVAVDADWDEFDHVALVAAQPDAPADLSDRRAFQRFFEEATGRWMAGQVVEGAGETAETFVGFLTRVRGALVRAVAAAGSGETVVVVTSGGPIAAAAAALVDPEHDLDDAGVAATARMWTRFNTVTVNSAVTRVLVGASGARLLTFNEHDHLSGDLLTYR